ncbi:dTMP kinase [Roseinatronobacter alkalisoli]|uniref:Thymidylate kinase n=1 Tax=Roseinatronobacter alkalisoli TaxID=3028235 RepID=A0ABT5T9T1_9RHOB|nr:dTMP kinase [Roseinatronobacter sp. HJB301]MDD7970683.1 dTMP kinase [Roseinatronobacter sp. HJB301]
MLQRPGTGIFLTFEGIDGSGKSTQARALATALQQDGRDVVLTREPGGSTGAEAIRRLLVEGTADRWSPETEILLFNAARRDHLEKTVLPALSRGAIVISDRFADSTRVYQGAARASLRPLVDQLHDLVIGFEPDMTFVIDMDAKAALSRGLARNSGEDRFEDMGADFQQALRAGFLDLARMAPDRVQVIDGARDMAAISADVLAIARRFIDGRAG